MTNFSINIVSDPVCPWCYIGRKRLEQAITLYKKVYPNGRHDVFTVTWEAYYLDASAPLRGISFEERQLQKLTSANTSASPEETRELAARFRERLTSIGREVGVAFSFRGKIGNTRSAHRAINYSRTCSGAVDAQDRFVIALFAAYFEGEADITSHEDIADVAESVRLDRAEMLAWLDSGKGGEEVDEQDRAARDMGLKGVPHFTVRGRRVDGAQEVQDFLELFVKIKEEEQEQITKTDVGKAAGSESSI
ncbi:putative thioredoxin [Xylaria bambusicola]|uniref:putative thioredoxin n=1 Tax=Xylaria bambusicola TaxID=326684 RepID=UPI002007A26E|nr:putative thioredoxin [Xylaria bambusicola]KAI0517367.1 putative thioredoxin [Xylaria bambusicola]